MIACQNCGQSNTSDTNFCRFCGNRLAAPPPQAQQQASYAQPAAPRPYAWKTDEFQTNAEARRTGPVGLSQQAHAAPAAFNPGQVAQNFRCPRCSTTFPPRVERQISTGGWITFAVLLVVFFPLFWIGLLIKEDVVQCQGCNLKLN
jgi:hypothetical protein